MACTGRPGEPRLVAPADPGRRGRRADRRPGDPAVTEERAGAPKDLRPRTGRVHAPVPLPALRRRVLVTGLVLLVLGLLVTVLVAASGARPGVQAVDDGWYRLMVGHRWSPVVTASDLLSTAFSAAVGWPVRILVTAVIGARRHWLALAAWATTVLLSEVLIGPTKAVVDRPRPLGSLIATSGSSYPSGHAIASAVTAIGVVMALTSGRRRLYWMVGAVLLAALVALSRTYLSAHWLSDVVGGSLLGAGLALAVPEAFEVARDRIRPAPEPAGR
jgi:undecaprenyl-diphosphatase